MYPQSASAPPLSDYNSLPNFVTTGRNSYTGYSSIDTLSNYSHDFVIQFNTYHRTLIIDKANLTGTIYDPTGRRGDVLRHSAQHPGRQ